MFLCRVHHYPFEKILVAAVHLDMNLGPHLAELAETGYEEKISAYSLEALRAPRFDSLAFHHQLVGDLVHSALLSLGMKVAMVLERKCEEVSPRDERGLWYQNQAVDCAWLGMI